MHIPRLEPQLDGSATQGADCGIASVVMELDFASGGKVRPETEEVRRRAQPISEPPGVKLAEAEKALESYDGEFKRAGLRAPEMTVRRLVDFEDGIGAPLDKGQAVHLMLDYATVNQKAPGFSSSPTFQGFHSAMALGRRPRRDGKPGKEIRVFDPLADGRRPGIHKGPQWWPQWLVEEASEAFVRKSLINDDVAPSRAKAMAEGKCTAGAVRVAKPLVVVDPDPDPVPATDAEKLAEALARLAEVTAERDAAVANDEAQLEVLYEARTALLDAARAVALGLTAIDALLPGNEEQADTEAESGVVPESVI